MAVMAVGLLAGCGTSGDGKSASKKDIKTSTLGDAENNTTDEAAENTYTPAGNGKILVVNYSATGNTKDVAEKIANITNGDLFEIKPTEPYTDDYLDWKDDNSCVSREHDDEKLRDVERLYGGASESDISSWIDSLGF